MPTLASYLTRASTPTGNAPSKTDRQARMLTPPKGTVAIRRCERLSMHLLPSTVEVSEALVACAEQNQQSMRCETEFAHRAKAHPQIMRARLGRIRYVLELIGAKPGDAILDIGAGVGLNSVLALLCGAGEVHAVEYESARLASARLVVDYLGISGRIYLHDADVLDLDLPMNSIAGAFSFEVLEHIRDTAKLYQNLARWLSGQGRVYARTGANGMNVLRRRLFRREWEKIDETYSPIRESVIREAMPGVGQDVIELLVARTRGQLKEAIQQVALEYQRNRIVPVEMPPCAPRNPETGEFMERLLNPYRNIELIDAQGFRTTLVRPNFRNITTVGRTLAGVQKVAGKVIALTHPISLYVAPWLEFLSERLSLNAGFRQAGVPSRAACSESSDELREEMKWRRESGRAG
jgi:ubiquinone/menaquinone biosynthesis C-methylase UbiE